MLVIHNCKSFARFLWDAPLIQEAYKRNFQSPGAWRSGGDKFPACNWPCREIKQRRQGVPRISLSPAIVISGIDDDFVCLRALSAARIKLPVTDCPTRNAVSAEYLDKTVSRSVPFVPCTMHTEEISIMEELSLGRLCGPNRKYEILRSLFRVGPVTGRW